MVFCFSDIPGHEIVFTNNHFDDLFSQWIEAMIEMENYELATELRDFFKTLRMEEFVKQLRDAVVEDLLQDEESSDKSMFGVEPPNAHSPSESYLRRSRTALRKAI